MRKIIQYDAAEGAWLPSVIWFDGTTYWQIGRGKQLLYVWTGKALNYGPANYNSVDDQRYHLANPYTTDRYLVGAGQDIDAWFQRCCTAWSTAVLQALKLAEVL